jgi:hypothetical protein
MSEERDTEIVAAMKLLVEKTGLGNHPGADEDLRGHVCEEDCDTLHECPLAEMFE